MKKSCLLIVLSSLFSLVAFTQNDSIVNQQKGHKKLLPKTFLPLTFIVAGSLYSSSQSEINVQRDIRNRVGNDYHNGADDYIQYIPFAQVYIGDIVGLDAKNHWFDQTKNMAISSVATGIVVHSFKRIIGKKRPDGSSNHAFPSGHTSNSFVGAAVLFNEFKDSSPLYAYSGFLISTTTGGLRVVNNRHWISDVVVGAGIGVFMTTLVYHFEPLKNWNPFKKNDNLSLYPSYNGQEYSFVAALRF